MSSKNGIEPKAPKPSFRDLCKRYNVNYDDMLGIANKAGVPIQVIQTMFVGKPVKRSDAVAVLARSQNEYPNRGHSMTPGYRLYPKVRMRSHE